MLLWSCWGVTGIYGACAVLRRRTAMSDGGGASSSSSAALDPPPLLLTATVQRRQHRRFWPPPPLPPSLSLSHSLTHSLSVPLFHFLLLPRKEEKKRKRKKKNKEERKERKEKEKRKWEVNRGTEPQPLNHLPLKWLTPKEISRWAHQPPKPNPSCDARSTSHHRNTEIGHRATGTS